MLKLKPGVRVGGATNEICIAVSVAAIAYQQYGADCVITSMCDGKHSVGSRHYEGDAFDVRVHNIRESDRDDMVKTLASALGADYDVLRESIGTGNEHIHIEYNPKKGINL